MNKKITSSVLAALMVVGTTSFTSFAAMSNGTVVIGSKAYDLAYANNPANLAEITKAIVEGGPVYVKDFSGDWINNITGLKVSTSVIPAVVYKNAEKTIDYDAEDKDIVAVDGTNPGGVVVTPVEPPTYYPPETIVISAISVITGTAQVGAELKAGALSPVGATVKYQWRISDLVGGPYTDIAGATASTYTPVASDATKFIKVVATGTGRYFGTVTSASTAQVENVAQLAPIGLTGLAPTSYGFSDGKITGTTNLMEYKISTDATYTAVTGAEITGLAAGTYNVRYAAKTGFNAGTAVDVVVAVGANAAQAAPTEALAGVAPTSYGFSDGKITGTTILMEYKLSTASTFTAVTGAEITGLASGTYNVRYAAKTGFNAGTTVDVVVAVGANVAQAAPTGLSGVAPTSYGLSDGKITGTTTLMEYKLSTASTFAVATGAEITGLAAGTYNVRYAAKTGFNAGAAVDVVVAVGSNVAQLAPIGLAGVAPTSYGFSDGKITGTTILMEYKLSTASEYTAATETEVTGLAAGTYNVRYAAKTGFNAGATVDVVVAVGANAAQAAPMSLAGVAPTSYGLSDGKITGTTNLMEYKLSTASTFTAVTGAEITGLASGTYNVRYAAKTGFNAGAAVDVVVAVGQNAAQSAPIGLSGIAPTSYGLNDGKITGTTTLMEYKLSTASGYTAATETEVTGLAAGTYNVRYAAKTGFNAGATVDVVVAVGANVSQAAPTGLTGLAPTYYGLSDGKITGTTNLMEYKLSTASEYTAATETEVTGLAAGTYNVRYAAKTGFNAGATVDVVVAVGQNAAQAAPIGLSGIAPTSYGLSDGKITGTTILMEYKLSTASGYTAATETEVTGLASGTYNVRYAAKTGFNAGAAVDVVVAVGQNAAQAAPIGLSGIASTSYGLSDGKITGTTILMEYKLSTASEYTAATETEVTGLAAGTYNVRYAAKTGFNAGAAVDVVVAVGSNVAQLAPTGLSGVAPTSYGLSDGKITGTTNLMEYKLSTDSTYTAVTGAEITGLASGTYNVRYAAKTGFNAGTTVDVVVAVGANVAQAAPTGLSGVAPTSYGLSDGKITGTTNLMEYKLSTDSTYTAVTGAEITGLASGTYNVRYAAKTGFNAGATVDVVVAVGANAVITDVTSSNYTINFDDNTITITLTGGTFKAAPIKASDFTFTGSNSLTLGYDPDVIFTRISDNVVTITGFYPYTLDDSNDNQVLVKVATQATAATSVEVVSSNITADITSAAFTVNSSYNMVRIQLNGGTFKAGPIVAGDFIFQGTNSTILSQAIDVTRLGDNVVIIRGLTGLTASSDNTVLVKAATQTKATTAVNIIASENYFVYSGNQITKYDEYGDKNVVIPSVLGGSPITSIGNDAFDLVMIDSVTIPEGITRIGPNAFGSNRLTSVTIPKTVTSIGNNAFDWNFRLANVRFCSSTVSIGSNLFRNDNITSITMDYAGVNIPDNFLGSNNYFRDAYLVGGAGTYTGTQDGTWTKVIVASPTATVGDVTVSGTSGSAITSKDVVITLANDAIKTDILTNTDLATWITNLPSGLTAVAKSDIVAGATTVTITITGTPTAVSSAAMAITIPAESLTSNANLTVTENANAKFVITAPNLATFTAATVDAYYSGPNVYLIINNLSNIDNSSTFDIKKLTYFDGVERYTLTGEYFASGPFAGPGTYYYNNIDGTLIIVLAGVDEFSLLGLGNLDLNIGGSDDNLSAAAGWNVSNYVDAESVTNAHVTTLN